MNYTRFITVAGLLCCAALADAQVTFTFDDLAIGPMSAAYSSQGVTFNFPTVRSYDPGFAYSGNKAIETCFASEFCSAPLNIDFTAGQKRVGIFVGYTSALGQSREVLLRAFDQNGATVAQASAVLGASNAAIPVQTPLQVVSAAPNIRRVSIGFAGADSYNNGLAFDNRTVDTAGAC